MELSRGTPLEAGEYYWAERVCGNKSCGQHEYSIPAPEYDWEYYGLSRKEITVLREECPAAALIEQEREEYMRMRRSRYRKVF